MTQLENKKNVKNKGKEIWEKIRSLVFPMYGVQTQTIEDCAKFLDVPNTDFCMLEPKTPTLIAGLDLLLSTDGQGNTLTNPRYLIEQSEKYIIIKENPDFV